MFPFYTLVFFVTGISFFFPYTILATPQHAAQFNSQFAYRSIKGTRVSPTPVVVTPTPTAIPPTPTAAPMPLLPTATPPSAPSVTSGGQQDLLNEVNAYRASQGLGPVAATAVTCNFAQTRAQEVSISFTHDGFENRVNQHTLPYASYHVVVENIAMNSNMHEVVKSWINSSGHAANLRADTLYACIARVGDYYAYEAWRP